MRDDAGAVNPALLVHDGKQIVRRVGRFRGAEEQVAVRTQREMKQLEDLPLHRPLQIDQHVAARDQVEMRERRIAQQAVRGEQNALAHRLGDHVMCAVPREIPLQQRGGHVARDRKRVGAGARADDRRLIDIGREYLDGLARHRGLARPRQQQRDRVRLFPGRASGYPHAHLLLAGFRREQRADHFLFEEIERFAIAEELGHADQHVRQQRVCFLRRGTQEIPVREEIALAVDLHAPFDTPQHGRPLVQPEIVAGAYPQVHQNVGKRPLRIVDRRPIDVVQRLREFDALLLDAARIRPEFEQPLRHVGRRQHDIDARHGNRVLRHLRILGVIRCLRKRDARPPP